MANNKKFILKTYKNLILASKSHTRYKMLKNTGLEIKRVVSNINEDKIKNQFKGKSFSLLASDLAIEKAKKISFIYPNSFVIGTDQICVLDNKIINKPRNKTQAINQLRQMQGKKHIQISAFALFHNSSMIGKGHDKASLVMRRMKIDIIRKYVNKDLPLNACGSYNFEKNGYLLFNKVIGNYDTIKGLPLIKLLDLLFEKEIIYYEKS